MKIFLFLAAVVVVQCVYAQTEFPQPDPNYKKHIKKVDVPPKNFVKFQLSNLVVGDFLFAYERQLHDAFSVEVSGGPNLLTTFDPLYNYMDDIQLRFNGYSFGAGGRFFMFHPGIHDRIYMSLAYRYKRYDHPNDYDMKINFLEPSFGYTLMTKNQLGIEFQVGYKLIVYNNTYTGPLDESSFEFFTATDMFSRPFGHMPIYLHLNVGYLF